MPGVLNAATTTNAPLLGGSWTHNIHIGSAEGASKFTWVSPSYLETMGIPLKAGRGFNPGDTAASPRVAIVNQAFIRKFTGGINPIGQTLRTSPEPHYPSSVYEIVGMVMREAGYMLLMGIVTGSVLSLIAGRGVSSLRFGLKPYDPLTLLVSIALLSLVAALASLVPARRAAKVDPMAALRYE